MEPSNPAPSYAPNAAVESVCTCNAKDYGGVHYPMCQATREPLPVAGLGMPAQIPADAAYEYATTTGPRKQWLDENTPPPGEGWERDPTRGNNGWERFDYHEEAYWRRLVGAADHGETPRTPESDKAWAEVWPMESHEQLPTLWNRMAALETAALSKVATLEARNKALEKARGDVIRDFKVHLEAAVQVGELSSNTDVRYLVDLLSNVSNVTPATSVDGPPEEGEAEYLRTAFEVMKQSAEDAGKEAADLAEGLAEETKLREKTQIALRDLIDAIPIETLEKDKPLKAWAENAELVLLLPDIEPDCTHDEQDHGICLACGEDRDMNSDNFGKKL